MNPLKLETFETVNTMTINLPELRNLSYRWELPTTIREACDYHFLDRVNFPQLASEATLEGKDFYIEKHGIKFQVTFQNGALESYAECLKQEQLGNPCVHKTFWLSYRSMSYKWKGEVKTISIVLVQPARPKVRSGSQEHKFYKEEAKVANFIFSGMKAHSTFADMTAQAMEKDTD